MANIKRNRGNYAASHWHVAKLPIAGLSTRGMTVMFSPVSSTRPAWSCQADTPAGVDHAQQIAAVENVCDQGTGPARVPGLLSLQARALPLLGRSKWSAPCWGRSGDQPPPQQARNGTPLGYPPNRPRRPGRLPVQAIAQPGGRHDQPVCSCDRVPGPLPRGPRYGRPALPLRVPALGDPRILGQAMPQAGRGRPGLHAYPG